MTIDYTASIVVDNSLVRKPQQTGSQPGMAAIPARGQLKREKVEFPGPRSHLRVWYRELGSWNGMEVLCGQRPSRPWSNKHVPPFCPALSWGHALCMFGLKMAGRRDSEVVHIPTFILV